MSKHPLSMLAATILVAAACSSGKGDAAGSPRVTARGDLAAEVASYEMLSGRPQRLLVGLFSASEGIVSYGTVSMKFSYLGTQESPSKPEPGGEVTGSFILVPNDDAGQPPVTDAESQADVAKAPALTQPDQTRGVYEASGVVFNRPGFWRVDVTVELDGQPQAASASFAVADGPSYPAIGDRAPLSENLLYGQKGVKPSEVDSRGTQGWRSIPDKALHTITVKDAVNLSLPVVVVISTPLYCQSRFCGPVTDEVQGLVGRYGDRAAFVHIEVWKNYQNKVINRAAAQWIYRNNEATEPWVFLVGADGKIIDRWQNVLDRPQLEEQLAQLPKAHTDL